MSRSAATLDRGQPGTATPPILAREMAFVTGKGGVGKTTVAAALALAARNAGRDAVVCEVGGQEQLAGRLPSVTIDPDAALAEWLERNVGRAGAALLRRSDVFGHLVAAAPGAREVVTIGKAWDLTRGPQDRLVVVDAPASGHAIALLEAPSTFAHLGGVGPIGHQAAALSAFFADPERCAIVLVCTPAELPVSETIELAARVEQVTGRPADLVVVNEVLPDRFSAAQVARVERALDSASGQMARRAWQRARDQAQQLDALRAALAIPMVELPFLFVPAIGKAQLRRLARRLSAQL
jgi:anion-transporting  ArsA/GET3 family ATPase